MRGAYIRRIAGALSLLAAFSTARAQLVAPPTFTSISIPATATLGSAISISATAKSNLSNNSDGNNWNTTAELEILRITVQYQPPGGSWTVLNDWMPTYQTPNTVTKSLTMNVAGTWNISFQAMDGRPWYSNLLQYSVVVSPPPTPTFTSSLTLPLNQGQSGSNLYQITATGSPTSYGASNLPSGLSLNTTTGVISGTVNTGTSQNATITATNYYGTASATLACNITAASISCNASISPIIVANANPLAGAQTVTLVRNGTANFGIAWTQGTIWKPDGTTYVLGNLPLGSYVYTPDGGTGTYSYQFRLVDNYYNYKDQWITFTVGSISPFTVTLSGGGTVDVTQSNPTISFGQSITANATATDPSAQMTSTEFAGDYGILNNWQTYGTANSFAATTSNSFSTTYTPTAVGDGAHLIKALGYSAGSTWWGQSFALTVQKTTPSGTFTSATKNPTSGGYTLTSSDLNAAFSNPYSSTVVHPTGAVTYKISATTTSLAPGSVIPSGTTVIVEADIAGDGNYNGSSRTATFTILGPTQPTNLAATSVGINYVSLGWTASTSSVGILKYQISRNGTVIGTSTTATYTDSTAVSSTTYTYTVSAIDNSNFASAPASLAVTTPAANTLPSGDQAVLSVSPSLCYGIASGTWAISSITPH